MFTLIIAVLLCIISYTWWRKQTPDELPPAYPGALPVIGHAHLLLGDGKYLWNLIKKVQQHSLENGGVTHLKLGSLTHYVISDNEDFITVIESLLEKNDWYKHLISPWIGTGLVSAPVSVWKPQQKLLYPAFGQHVVDGYMPIHNDQTRSLMANLDNVLKKGPFEPLQYIGRSALESNFLTAFGLEIDGDTVEHMETYMNAFVEIRRVITKRIQTLWMHNDFIYGFTELKKRQDRALSIIRTLTDMIIKRKRAALNNSACSGQQLNKKGKRFKGFMDLALELGAGGALTDDDIKFQVNTMILAGYDTTSTTITYACMLIGSHPDVQEKVYQELQEVFGGSDRDVEKEDMPRLVYMEAVLKEVGRLYPAAPVIGRYVDKNLQLKNYTMKAGSSCLLMLSGINRHQIWGEDREQFRPERWLEPTSLPPHANSFTGFSMGRRACIGKPYAVNLMKITLAHLLRRYKITSDYTKMELQMEIFLKPSEGTLISLEPRYK